MENIKKIHFELSAEKDKELHDLMNRLGITSKKDLINNALTFLQWALNEKCAGRIIASIDKENKRFKPVRLDAIPDAFSQ